LTVDIDALVTQYRAEIEEALRTPCDTKIKIGKNKGVERSYPWKAADYLGSPPKGYVWMHMCHKRNCANRNHLRLGTYTENRLDTDVLSTGTLTHFNCGCPRVPENMTSNGPSRPAGRCRTCRAQRQRDIRAAKKAAV